MKSPILVRTWVTQWRSGENASKCLKNNREKLVLNDSEILIFFKQQYIKVLVWTLCLILNLLSLDESVRTWGCRITELVLVSNQLVSFLTGYHSERELIKDAASYGVCRMDVCDHLTLLSHRHIQPWTIFVVAVLLIAFIWVFIHVNTELGFLSNLWASSNNSNFFWYSLFYIFK